MCLSGLPHLDSLKKIYKLDHLQRCGDFESVQRKCVWLSDDQALLKNKNLFWLFSHGNNENRVKPLVDFGPDMTMSFQQNEGCRGKAVAGPNTNELTSLGYRCSQMHYFCYGNSFSNGMLSDIWHMSVVAGAAHL